MLENIAIPTVDFEPDLADVFSMVRMQEMTTPDL